MRAAALSMLAGIVLSACATTGTLKVTTSVPANPEVGQRAVDIGMLRLWVPFDLTSPAPGASWGVTVVGGRCVEGGSCPPRTCAPGPTPGIYVTRRPPSLPCEIRAVTDNINSVWVQFANGPQPMPGPFEPASPPVPLEGWGGQAVRQVVPALGVTLYGFGVQGIKVVRSFGPSGLAGVLHRLAHGRPVSWPRGWRTVQFGNVEASVPSTWQVADLSAPPIRTGRFQLNPGVCGEAFFSPFASRGAAYVGSSRASPACPIFTADMEWTLRSFPSYGLWLASRHPEAASPPTTLRRHGTQELTIGQHGLVLRVSWPSAPRPAGSLDVQITCGGTVTTGAIGVSQDPVLAEQILSSIRPVSGCTR